VRSLPALGRRFTTRMTDGSSRPDETPDAFGRVGQTHVNSDDGAGTWLPASPCPRRLIAGH
jgi:hypothetical protein